MLARGARPARYLAARFDHRGFSRRRDVFPEFFQSVELTHPRQHHVHDDVGEIDEHPLAFAFAFHAHGAEVVLLGELDDAIGDGFDVSIGIARRDDDDVAAVCHLYDNGMPRPSTTDGALGEPCEAADECAAALCVALADGSAICSIPCDGDCPADYRCVPLVGGSSACVPEPAQDAGTSLDGCREADAGVSAFDAGDVDAGSVERGGCDCRAAPARTTVKAFGQGYE